MIDAETFNKIETLNDNEVKKPTNKRKRNQTAILLGLSVPQPRSSKRVSTATAATQQAAVILSKATGGVGGGGGGGIIAIAPPPLLLQQSEKPTANTIHYPNNNNNNNNNSSNKGLLITTTASAGSQQSITTNIKKRPRIMSLYERPFQAGNDGRGGGSGNGYLSSASSRTAGGGSGSLMINDLNDTQEMSGSQYYLSGSAGGGSVTAITAANVNTVMVVGNGSAINHAPTMATLCNIGNTCYLNSVVYTLRFAPQFLHNLHHLLADLNALQQNVARAKTKSSSLSRGLNANNIDGNARSWSSKDLASVDQYSNATASSSAAGSSPSSALSQVTQKSSHQVLTEKLHELYQSLHRNEMNESTEPHHSDTLLHAIQDVSTIFEGNQQQDAHEFLMCVLNSIRETSQTLIKAVAECPDVILNGYVCFWPEDLAFNK